jgi:hypothetical protein
MGTFKLTAILPLMPSAIEVRRVSGLQIMEGPEGKHITEPQEREAIAVSRVQRVREAEEEPQEIVVLREVPELLVRQGEVEADTLAPEGEVEDMVRKVREDKEEAVMHMVIQEQLVQAQPEVTGLLLQPQEPVGAVEAEPVVMPTSPS